MNNLDVSPYFAIDNHAHGSSTNAKLLRDSPSRHALHVSAANGQCDFFCDSTAPVFRALLWLLAKVRVCMFVVLRHGDVFKVFKSRVSFAPVDVIDLESFRSGTNEGKHDKSMNEDAFTNVFSLQPYARIGSWIFRIVVRLEQSLFLGMIAKHLPLVTDHVQPFVSGHITPFHRAEILA